MIREGILPLYKESGQTSFSLIRHLRKLGPIKKIGHAGTLDPFAEGVMILLVGREFTKQASSFQNQDKEYRATLYLGSATTTFDPEGEVTQTSDKVPTQDEVEEALTQFQGTIEQTPPMFSAKKVGGKKLYELARKGIEIERKPALVTLKTELISYTYPELILHITCSKGTYIRSIGHDLGVILGSFAHLQKLIRTRCGPYTLADCTEISELV